MRPMRHAPDATHRVECRCNTRIDVDVDVNVNVNVKTKLNANTHSTRPRAPASWGASAPDVFNYGGPT